MKKQLLSSLLFLFLVQLFAQAPRGFSYQAIYRDIQGNAIGNQNVNVKLTIIDSIANGASLYSETHNVQTNEFGLVTLTVGSGSVLTGNFSNINWGDKSKFLKVEFDGTIISTTQLLSVPYALYAENGSSWKDTTFNDFGTIRKSVFTNDWATIAENDLNRGVHIVQGGLEMWANKGTPAIDFKNSISRDAELRIAYDSTGIGKLTISSQDEDNQWKWDRFVFTKEGNFGISSKGASLNIPKSKIQVDDGDIYLSSINKGVIMKSPNGQCWRMTVSNTGAPVFNSITCP